MHTQFANSMLRADSSTRFHDRPRLSRITNHESRITSLGFTLIELLVVIAVIALLAAMIIPITGKVSELRIKNKARGELKQVETAINVYKTKLGYYPPVDTNDVIRSEEHTSELQSRLHLVCRLLLE